MTEENNVTQNIVTTIAITEFNLQTLKDFQEFSLNEGNKEIFLCSSGGSINVAVSILDIINRNPEEYTIKISELCMSSAFLLVHLSKCKIIDISSQYYLPVNYMQHFSILKGNITKKEIKDALTADMYYWELLFPVMTGKQIKRVKLKHKLLNISYKLFSNFSCDIEFTTEQMKELLKERFSVR